jgi:hypothetical protein
MRSIPIRLMQVFIPYTATRLNFMPNTLSAIQVSLWREKGS